MKKVRIVCDGSSLSNGRSNPRAAAAAILEFEGKRRIVGEYLGAGTNQQAEVVAASIGLESLREPCEVEVITDSRYVVETMRGAFKRKTNHEFWRRLDKAAGPHRVHWQWTRGHAGHPVQEICDDAAKMIAESGRVDQDALDDLLGQQ